MRKTKSRVRGVGSNLFGICKIVKLIIFTCVSNFKLNIEADVTASLFIELFSKSVFSSIDAMDIIFGAKYFKIVLWIQQLEMTLWNSIPFILVGKFPELLQIYWRKL